MTVFGSFISLETEDQWLVLKTFLLNYYIRLILWILPFKRVQKIAQNMGKKTNKISADVSHLMWAVNISSHYVFRSTCLTRALTGQILLDQHGYESKLRIGVLNDGKFEAHAWLEHDKEVVLGKSEREFMLLADI